MEPGWEMLLLLFLALLAEVAGTLGGFGSSMLFVPLAGLFLDYHSVLGVTALFHVGSNLSKIALFKEGIDRKLVFQIGLPSVLMVIAGAWLSSYANEVLLSWILGLFLVIFSALLLSGRLGVIPDNSATRYAGGSLSGFAAGLLGTGGAIRGLLLSALVLPKTVFIATSAFIDLAIDVSRSVVYVGNGFVRWSDLPLVAMLLVLSFVGSWLGKKLLDRIPEQRFQQMVLFLILFTGLFILAKAAFWAG